MNHCQHVMYLLSSRLHGYSGLRSFFSLSSHKVVIAFLHVLHPDVAAWFFLGQLKSCIRLKLVALYVSVCWRWVPWLLLISLMNKIPLDMPHQFMARSSEVVNYPSGIRCVLRQASCMCGVDTSGPRWCILIWFVDVNFRTSIIQDSICSHCWVSV